MDNDSFHIYQRNSTYEQDDFVEWSPDGSQLLLELNNYNQAVTLNRNGDTVWSYSAVASNPGIIPYPNYIGSINWTVCD